MRIHTLWPCDRLENCPGYSPPFASDGWDSLQYPCDLPLDKQLRKWIVGEADRVTVMTGA